MWHCNTEQKGLTCFCQVCPGVFSIFRVTAEVLKGAFCPGILCVLIPSAGFTRLLLCQVKCSQILEKLASIQPLLPPI